MESCEVDVGPVAVLGASGFIGRHVIAELARRGIPAVAVARRPMPGLACPTRVIPTFDDDGMISEALDGTAQVVHLADESSRLATADNGSPIAASLAKVLAFSRRRLIFASSIYARLDEEGVGNAYGRRKRTQESLLLATGCAIGLRLPPVYGEGCGGSFAMLAKAIASGLPLPLGLATAQRSYLSIGNLCDLIATLLQASDESWQRGAPALYEPEDRTRISARDLARAMAEQRRRGARLIPIPKPMLSMAARALGREELITGAFDPLEARDNAVLSEIFGWVPREGLPGSLPD